MKKIFNENFWLIALASGLVILPMFATDIYISSLPIVQNFFTTDDYNIKLSLNIYMLGFAISALLSGALSDYFSKYHILVLGLIAFLFSSLVISNTTSINTMIIARGIEGLGGGMGTTLARLILKERLNSQDRFFELKALSIVSSSISISPLIGPMLGASLEKFFGWESIFYSLSIMSLILIVGVLLTQKKEKHNKKCTISNMVITYTALLKNTSFMLPTILISLACSSEFIFISQSSFLYQIFLNYNPFQYSIIVSLVLLSFLIGSYSVNRLVKRFSNSSILKTTGYLCCFFSFFPLLSLIIDSKDYLLYSTVFSSIISMIGVGIVVPLTQSIAMNFSKTFGNSAAGLFFFIELSFIAFIGYSVSLFDNQVKPMIFGILFCWIAFVVISLISRKKALSMEE